MRIGNTLGPAIVAVAATVALIAATGGPAAAATVTPQSANLAHISPWDNSACSTNVAAGTSTTVYYQYVDLDRGATINKSLGTVQYRHSSNGSCTGYQWIHFTLSMSAVHTYLGTSPTLEFYLWINGNMTSYVDMNVTFTGGQADGDFQSYAVKAGAAKTASKILGSSAAPAYSYEFYAYYNGPNPSYIWIG